MNNNNYYWTIDKLEKIFGSIKERKDYNVKNQSNNFQADIDDDFEFDPIGIDGDIYEVEIINNDKRKNQLNTRELEYTLLSNNDNISSNELLFVFLTLINESLTFDENNLTFKNKINEILSSLYLKNNIGNEDLYIPEIHADNCFKKINPNTVSIRDDDEDWNFIALLKNLDFDLPDISQYIKNLKENRSLDSHKQPMKGMKWNVYNFFLSFLSILLTEFQYYDFYININLENNTKMLLNEIIDCLNQKKNLILVYKNNFDKNIWQGIISNYLNKNNISSVILKNSLFLVYQVRSHTVGAWKQFSAEFKNLCSMFTTQFPVCYWFDNLEPIINFGITREDVNRISETTTTLLTEKMFQKASNIIWLRKDMFEFKKWEYNKIDSNNYKYIYLPEITSDNIFNFISQKTKLSKLDSRIFSKFYHDYLSKYSIQDILDEYNISNQKYQEFLFHKISESYNSTNISNIINILKDLQLEKDASFELTKILKLVNDTAKIQKSKPYSLFCLGEKLNFEILNKKMNLEIFHELDLSKIRPHILFSSNTRFENSLLSIVKNYPNSIICINNIQHASKETITMFLNILDEGYFVDDKNEKHYCYLNTFIFTDSNSDKILAYQLEKDTTVRNFLNSFYPHEFIARFTNIIFINKNITLNIANEFASEFIYQMSKITDIKITFNMDTLSNNIDKYIEEDDKLLNLKFEIMNSIANTIQNHNNGSIILFCEFHSIAFKYVLEGDEND
ncbi:hypothetical protein [Mycoplasma seminis]|uniref:Uncharacterized protein n=1 Tax=Mycoplasma seminis TaxID=512749 RepID=A0ABY9HC59_9MOLU|nr:hypothetical protein [Mycoplasma seminis]WLP85770.1 hypothetical protein Q8852_01305 [Mycoplasma seminis]